MTIRQLCSVIVCALGLAFPVSNHAHKRSELPPATKTKKLTKKRKKLLPKKKKISRSKLHEQALQKAAFIHTHSTWNMPQQGRSIHGRFYSGHALERMAPPTPQVIKELARRALQKGFSRRSKAFKKYIQPRNIAPLWVEEVIKKGKRQPNLGHRARYFYKGLTVITSKAGNVITTY